MYRLLNSFWILHHPTPICSILLIVNQYINLRVTDVMDKICFLQSRGDNYKTKVFDDYQMPLFYIANTFVFLSKLLRFPHFVSTFFKPNIISLRIKFSVAGWKKKNDLREE